MKQILPILLIGCKLAVSSQVPHVPEPMYPSCKGLVMCGYQGWFRADGDEANRGWGHYGRGSEFDPGNNTIDFWPDVSEYEKTYETVFRHADGTPARVFSSLDKSTTMLQFK